MSNLLIRNEQARTRSEQQRAGRAQQLAEARARQIAEDLDRLRAANALLDRGRWYLGERRWDDANDAFTRAIELCPDHVSLWTWRGDMYAGLGLWDLAGTDIAREVELREPDFTLRCSSTSRSAARPATTTAAAARAGGCASCSAARCTTDSPTTSCGPRTCAPARSRRRPR